MKRVTKIKVIHDSNSSIIRDITIYYMEINAIRYGASKLYIAYFHEDNEIKRVFRLSKSTFKDLQLSKSNIREKAFHLLGYDLDVCAFVADNTSEENEAREILGIEENAAWRDIENKLKNLTRLQYVGYDEDTLLEINDEGGKSKNTLYLMPFTSRRSFNSRLCANMFSNETDVRDYLHQIEACDSYLDDYDLDCSLANGESWQESLNEPNEEDLYNED